MYSKQQQEQAGTTTTGTLLVSGHGQQMASWQVRYMVNGIDDTLRLPCVFLDRARPEDMAELAVSSFWRARPAEEPSDVSQVHLVDVMGVDLGVFEVRREMRPVFTAKAVSRA